MEQENQNIQATFTKQDRREARREEKESQRSAQTRKKIIRKVAVWGGMLLVLILVVFGLSRLDGGTDLPPGQLVRPVDNEDWIKGNPSAAITLVEYGDFQCPACGAYYGLLKEILPEFNQTVRVVYRHYPLERIHPNARRAAQAAEAAGAQGKFWEMHDKLFESQSKWSNKRDATDDFVTYAGEIGLNIDQFKKDMDSSTINDKINADISTGNEAKVSATPTFYLNGQKLTKNPQSAEDFKSILNGSATP